MVKIYQRLSLLTVITGTLLSSCFTSKKTGQAAQQASAYPIFSPCSSEAGRLDIEWAPVFAHSNIKLVAQYQGQALPQDYVAFLVNNSALSGFLTNLSDLPIDKQTMTLPVMGGRGCMEFQLLSTETNGHQSPGRHWEAISLKNKGYKATIDFDGTNIKALISENGAEEALISWKSESGAVYYLLYPNNH